MRKEVTYPIGIEDGVAIWIWHTTVGWILGNVNSKTVPQEDDERIRFADGDVAGEQYVDRSHGIAGTFLHWDGNDACGATVGAKI